MKQTIPVIVNLYLDLQIDSLAHGSGIYFVDILNFNDRRIQIPVFFCMN